MRIDVPSLGLAPLRQGELDGLCGVYAVVNAFRLLLPDIDVGRWHAELFRELVGTLPRRRFPKVLWEGASYGDLKRMVLRAEDLIWQKAHLKRKVLATFGVGAECRRITDYWAQLDTRLNAGDQAVAVIGLTHPKAHWTVISRQTPKSAILFDSEGEQFRLRRGDFGLGPTSRAAVRLDRGETIVLTAYGTD